MIDFLESLVHYIQIFVDFLVAMITNLVQLIGYVPRAFATLTEVFAMLPPFLTVPIMAVVALSVIISLLNKWG